VARNQYLVKTEGHHEGEAGFAVKTAATIKIKGGELLLIPLIRRLE